MLVTADYAEVNAEGIGSELLNRTNNPVFEDTITALYGDYMLTSDSYDWKVNQVVDDKHEDEQQGLSLDINYEFAGGIKLRSITAVREWDATYVNGDAYYTVELFPGDTEYSNKILSCHLTPLSV